MRRRRRRDDSAYASGRDCRLTGTRRIRQRTGESTGNLVDGGKRSRTRCCLTFRPNQAVDIEIVRRRGREGEGDGEGGHWRQRLQANEDSIRCDGMDRIDLGRCLGSRGTQSTDLIRRNRAVTETDSTDKRQERALQRQQRLNRIRFDEGQEIADK